MKRIKTIAELRAALAAWREAGDSIALVPTMGNLHAGHLELVTLAQEHAEHTVVSVFVNPTQFGPAEDFAAYPRTPETDARRLRRAKAAILFEPSVEEMYGNGVEAATRVVVPGLSDQLCGASRPGHFVGVTSVVNRLLNICGPGVAVFGQKDYQQLVILQRMVSDLHLPVKLLAGATARDERGLALSSRNAYLDVSQQATAAVIYQSLEQARGKLEHGQIDIAAIEAEGLARIRAGGLEPEYFTVRQASDLAVPAVGGARLVVLAAARIAGVRLIDNVLVEVQP